MYKFRGRPGFVCLVFALFVVFFTSSSYGQSVRGALTGNVADSSGAVIAGANIVATETETGASETISTGSEITASPNCRSAGTTSPIRSRLLEVDQPWRAGDGRQRLHAERGPEGRLSVRNGDGRCQFSDDPDRELTSAAPCPPSRLKTCRFPWRSGSTACALRRRSNSSSPAPLARGRQHKATRRTASFSPASPAASVRQRDFAGRRQRAA